MLTKSDEATVQMRLARTYIQDYHDRWEKDGRIYGVAKELDEASRALQRATALDPTATIQEPTSIKGKEVTYTQDTMAAELLYLEAYVANLDAGEREKRLIERIVMWPTRHFDLKRARTAIERALKFAPLNLLYLRQYAIILQNQGNMKEARRIVARALEIDPRNIDTHRLKDQLK